MESKYGKAKEGLAYEARKIVLGKEFWKRANDIVKVYEPLVKVLCLMDKDDNPTIGYIYEAVDRAKRAIKDTCHFHQEYLHVVDNR